MKEYLVYTAGTMSGLSYKQMTEWRDKAKEVLAPYNIFTISPTRGKVPTCTNSLTTPKGINTRDYSA